MSAREAAPFKAARMATANSAHSPAAASLAPPKRATMDAGSSRRRRARRASAVRLFARASSDPQAALRQIPALFAQDEPEDRPAPQSRHLQFPRGGRAARARGAILQAALRKPRLRDVAARETERRLSGIVLNPALVTIRLLSCTDPLSSAPCCAGHRSQLSPLRTVLGS
jgi:hypothetical protein